MSRRQIPVDFGPDWPRKAAQAVNWLLGRAALLEGLQDFADDAAAAAGGIAVGAFYRSGSVVKVRVS